MVRASGKGRRTAFDDGHGFIRSIKLVRDEIPSGDVYPFSIPALRALEELELHPRVTFLVGENGSGKSTLIEAIAIAAGFNAEGGSKHLRFEMRPSESALHHHLRLSRGARRERDGFFLRAESFFNVATAVDSVGVESYGGVSLHAQSHGESFMALALNRFGGQGLYIFDEPEAALSPQRQLSFLSIMAKLVAQRSQLIIATHSPILMAYPDASILRLGADGVIPTRYEDTEHFQITRDFLSGRERFFKHLFAANAGEGAEGE